MIQKWNEKLPVCSYCLKSGHSSFGCHEKPKKAINQYKGLKVSSSFGGKRKPMNKIGRVSRATSKAVADWRKTIKPNHAGYYQCHYCGCMTKDIVTEHMESKARRPDLRDDPANYVLACNPCNGKKLSKSHDEFCLRCVK